MEILQEGASELHSVAENLRISEQMLEPKDIQKIKHIETFLFECCDDFPNDFWANHRNEVSLPFVKGHHIVPHRSKSIAIITKEIQIAEKKLPRCHQ